MVTQNMHQLIEPAIVPYESDSHLHSMLRFATSARDCLPATPTTNTTLKLLIERFIKVAEVYYQRGICILESNASDNNSFNRNQILNKIGTEWAFLNELIGAAKALPPNDKALQLLTKVVYAAYSSMHLGSKRIAILPHYGRSFKLVQFHYAPEVAIVGVPITSLYYLRDWSFAYHEVAELAIHEAAGFVDDIAAAVRDRGVWEKWKAQYAAEIQPLPWREGAPKAEVQLALIKEHCADMCGALLLGSVVADTLEATLNRYYSQAPRRRINVQVQAGPERVIIERRSDGMASPEGAHGTAVEATTDLSHPPVALRVCVVRSLCNQISGCADDVDDEGARVLAAEFLKRRARVVKSEHIFRPSRDDQAVRDAQALFENGQIGLPAHHVPANIMIAAARRSYDHQPSLQDNILEAAQTITRSYRAPANTSHLSLTDEDSFGTSIQSASSMAELIQVKWSRRDQGDASESGSHGYYDPYMWVSVSGVATDHGPHDGVALLWH